MRFSLAFLATSLGTWILPTCAHAQTPASSVQHSDSVAPATEKSVEPAGFTFYFENDAFGDTDESYTNGVQAIWLRFRGVNGLRRASGDTVAWDRSRLSRLPEGGCQPKNEPNAVACGVLTLGLGQTMHTPVEIERPEPLRDQRPYAGWTYLSGSLSSVWKPDPKAPRVSPRQRPKPQRFSDTPIHALTLEAQVGVLGPGASARNTQSMAHWWWAPGAVMPQGWHNQLENQFGGNFSLRYSRTVRNDFNCDGCWELTGLGGVQAGTVMNAATTGARLRFGWRMPIEYGPLRMSTTLPPRSEESESDKPQWYDRLWAAGFLEGNVRAVAHNAFVTGSYADAEWRRESLVSLRKIGSDFAIGGSLGFGNAALSYRALVRSPEHSAPGKRIKPHRFGILTLTLGQGLR